MIATQTSSPDGANRAFVDYLRFPEDFGGCTVASDRSDDRGYFRFGQDTICYGSTAAGFRSATVHQGLYDAEADVVTDAGRPRLPFDPTEAIENLRRERYVRSSDHPVRKTGIRQAHRSLYYFLRPAMPVSVRKHLQRLALKPARRAAFPRWPVDRSVENVVEQVVAVLLRTQGIERIPFIWFWPNGAPSCTIVTHDVEAVPGRNFCARLMDLDDAVGVKSSFQIVPEQRYSIPDGFLQGIRERGFEINIHDLNHDGHLFASRRVFLERVEKINRYGRQFAALGFRSGSLYRNLDWFETLDFSYDMSVPNVGHLEAQGGGCCTVMPFFIGNTLELPVTTTQDYSLFHILGDYSINLWKEQIALISEKHGLMSFIVHPDYILDTRTQNVYRTLLDHLARLRSDGATWIALPKEVDEWWRQRSQMSLKCEGGTWRIDGPGKDRARIAYASLDHDQIVYAMEQGAPAE